MTPLLPRAFLGAPLAHRALHDVKQGRPENSPAAIKAAIDAGYGIEIDVQLSADGEAMVFHDEALERLTGRIGMVRDLSAAQLGQVQLKGGSDSIPTLAEVLDLVAGRVALLIEIKDQDGAMGPGIGLLEQAVARALLGYHGPVAVMSFNPHSVAEMARLAPDVTRGIVTSAYSADDWPELPAAVCDRLRDIPDADRTHASFISHEAADLGRKRVADLKAAGMSVLCWTIRSPEQEAKARQVADNITFEGYLAAMPG